MVLKLLLFFAFYARLFSNPSLKNEQNTTVANPKVVHLHEWSSSVYLH